MSPHAFIETAKGTIEIELSVLDAPQTAQNFIALARRGYFNGLQIHRVVPNFVIQGGDPRGDGSGGPGYSIRDELNDRPYVRGTVGMALSGPDTGGSQFFITHSPAPHLDAKYTVFGHVVKGMEIVDKIQQLDVIQRVQDLGRERTEVKWKFAKPRNSEADTCLYKQKRGRRSPPFLAGRGSYRFLPPFFFPPFAAFFAIVLIPPFVWDSFARSILRIAAPLPSGTSAVRLPPLDASLLLSGVNRVRGLHLDRLFRVARGDDPGPF